MVGCSDRPSRISFTGSRDSNRGRAVLASSYSKVFAWSEVYAGPGPAARGLFNLNSFCFQHALCDEGLWGQPGPPK